VRSANARVGAALGDFLPRIGLTALYGGVSSDLSAITSTGAGAWSVAANVPDRSSRAVACTGNTSKPKPNCRKQTSIPADALGAFHDVANALVAGQKLEAVRVQQARAVAAIRRP